MHPIIAHASRPMTTGTVKFVNTAIQRVFPIFQIFYYNVKTCNGVTHLVYMHKGWKGVKQKYNQCMQGGGGLTHLGMFAKKLLL